MAQSRSEQFKEGDRVLALPTIPHTGLAEYFVSSDDRAVLLPDGQANHLVLSQPLGTVVHAYRKLPEASETAVVLGQGPIGQLFTALLRNVGVARLIAVDLLPERLKVSTRMGATHAVCGNATEVAAAIERITEGKLVDLAVEAIGKEETLNLGCETREAQWDAPGLRPAAQIQLRFRLPRFLLERRPIDLLADKPTPIEAKPLSRTTSTCVRFGSGPLTVALAHAGDTVPACWYGRMEPTRNVW